jgi:hypothetical protein
MDEPAAGFQGRGVRCHGAARRRTCGSRDLAAGRWWRAVHDGDACPTQPTTALARARHERVTYDEHRADGRLELQSAADPCSSHADAGHRRDGQADVQTERSADGDSPADRPPDTQADGDGDPDAAARLDPRPHG